jgi:hypothetical protein
MPTYDSALSAEVQATTLLPAPTLDTVTTDATSADLDGHAHERRHAR